MDRRAPSVIAESSSMFWFKRAQITNSEPPLDAAAIVRRARRLRFAVRPRALSALAGAYLGARPGTGLTFAELRAYEPGDDVRHIDWNVTARQGRPYVRRYVEERSLTLWLVVDVSASMRFGPPGKCKADRAAQAAALLASAAIQNGDRAGLVMVSDQIEAEVFPNGGDRHLARLLRTLVATGSTSRKTVLWAGVDRLARTGRRGLVVVLSDWLADEPAPAWRSLVRRHEVVAIRMVDPREEALPSVGNLALEDAETSARQRIDTGSGAVRAAYARAAAERRSAWRSWCADALVANFEIRTDADPIGPLLRFFQGRADRRRSPQ